MRVSFSVFLLALILTSVATAGESSLLVHRHEVNRGVGKTQDQAQTDTSESVPHGEIYPARGLILSLAIPGAGQWYAGEKTRSLVFAGLEVAGLVAWYRFRRKGEDKITDYERFADEHWSLQSWVEWAGYLYAQGEEYHDVIIDGTHHLKIILDGRLVSSDTLGSPDWQGDLEALEVIRSSEFYENVGKYDQFVSGWDDIFNQNGEQAWELHYKDVGDTVEVIILTKNKRRYLDLRKDSNRAFQIAGYAVSAMMLNHVVSAIDAFWVTRRRAVDSPRINTSLRPLFTTKSKFGIAGISVSISW
ncbi:MAG: hypothetical protein V3U24_01180 [Candidatus Neomarinimicrobiota bacterium]